MVAIDARSTELAIYNRLISNKGEWNNCFIKKKWEILLDLVDKALWEQPEENLMVVISRAWRAFLKTPENFSGPKSSP